MNSQENSLARLIFNTNIIASDIRLKGKTKQKQNSVMALKESGINP